MCFIPNPVHRPGSAILASGALLSVLLYALWNTPELHPDAMQPTHEVPAVDVGMMLLNEHLLAFEVLSVLLLAAMVGAIVLSRRSDP